MNVWTGKRYNRVANGNNIGQKSIKVYSPYIFGSAVSISKISLPLL